MKPRILIVEDEQPLMLLLRYNLEAEGYEVEGASRGDEANLRLHEQVPDLVLLDWILPGCPASSCAAVFACATRPKRCPSSC